MSEQFDAARLIFGRLSWESIPLHEPILLATFAGVVLGGLAVLALLTRFKLWGMLWRDWICSIDHKKIGIMYMILGIVMLLRGFADALMMRAQQAAATVDGLGFLPPHHYDQVFTAHGTIMIFFVAMALVTGLMNYVVPLQIGARDVAFPFLNNFSFWMTTAGAILVMVSLFIGEFSTSGWLALSNLGHNPEGVGLDYYIWSLQIAGVGTTLSGINLLVTIIKMRAPGMTLMKMPVFVWTSLCTNALIVASFPVLTATYMLGGDKDPGEILASVKNGLYAVNFGGGHCTANVCINTLNLAGGIWHRKTRQTVTHATLHKTFLFNTVQGCACVGKTTGTE